MEYVIVNYTENRGVLLDGDPAGDTKQTLMVEEGHHEFALAGAADYAPASQVVLV